MPEFGGPESSAPGEGASGAPEQLSEQARQRFAAAAGDMKAIKREEKRSKKRDDGVAKTIIQFLHDPRYTHLFVLISRLVARDCPSVFILSVLSLIHEECLTVTQEYLKEMGQKTSKETEHESIQHTQSGSKNALANSTLIEWITRMQMVLSLESEQILTRLMLDEHTIDGTVLQLTTFVLQEFFKSPAGGSKDLPFEQLHPLTASILQTVFDPFMSSLEKKLLQKSQEAAAAEDEDEDE